MFKGGFEGGFLMDYKGVSFDLLNHDSVLITSKDLVIYIDPYGLSDESGLKKADIIFISHPHYDHCSPDDLLKVSSDKTIIVATPDCEDNLSGIPRSEIIFAVPDKDFVVKDVKVSPVRAYNIGKKFHPKDNNWLGYILRVDGVVFYFAGDTDLIPEMNVFPDIDVAFLPCSGTYVMNAEEAAHAAVIIQPEIAVPMHYGSIVGSLDDALSFKKKVEFNGLKAVILNE